MKTDTTWDTTLPSIWNVGFCSLELWSNITSGWQCFLRKHVLQEAMSCRWRTARKVVTVLGKVLKGKWMSYNHDCLDTEYFLLSLWVVSRLMGAASSSSRERIVECVWDWAGRNRKVWVHVTLHSVLLGTSAFPSLASSVPFSLWLEEIELSLCVSISLPSRMCREFYPSYMWVLFSKKRKGEEENLCSSLEQSFTPTGRKRVKCTERHLQ